MGQTPQTLFVETGKHRIFLISGFFRQSGGNMTVQAILFDVPSESVRASVSWSGITGLSLFDALEEIQQDFFKEVDRILPESGRTLITQQETVFLWVMAMQCILKMPHLYSKMLQESSIFLAVWGGEYNAVINWDLDISTLFSFHMGLQIRTIGKLSAQFNLGLNMGMVNITAEEFNDEPGINVGDSIQKQFFMVSFEPVLIYSITENWSIKTIIPGVDYTFWHDYDEEANNELFSFIVTPVQLGVGYRW